MILTRTMTVDPGFGGTAWAFWRGDLRPLTGIFRRNQIAGPGALSVPGELEAMCAQWSTLLRIAKKNWDLDRIVIEGVSYWSSLKSQTAAGKGDLSRLSYLVGAYVQTANVMNLKIDVIDPTRWKGTMKDKAVEARVLRAMGRKYAQHIREAVGIGLGIMKRL